MWGMYIFDTAIVLLRDSCTDFYVYELLVRNCVKDGRLCGVKQIAVPSACLCTSCA
jgi:hypothetical protein